MRTISLIIVGAALLSACSEAPPRSVEWYVENEQERETLLLECAKNAVPASVECLNAQKAKDSLALKRRGYVKPEPVDFSGED